MKFSMLWIRRCVNVAQSWCREMSRKSYQLDWKVNQVLPHQLMRKDYKVVEVKFQSILDQSKLNNNRNSANRLEHLHSKDGLLKKE